MSVKKAKVAAKPPQQELDAAVVDCVVCGKALRPNEREKCSECLIEEA